MFQNVLMDPKILKKKQISLFFSNIFWNLCVLSKKKLNHYVSPISYRYKYVLFHLNMSKLFQEINIFFSEIKLVFNKKISLKYLIQGFIPHLFS